ncbi:MAG: trehalase-like domain-containing protein, partial [Nitriliruptorales bacterium]
MSDQPIADHALLSDCHSGALVDKRGSVEWWCVPRFDSPSVFARLLDDERGGHFALTPADVVDVARRYDGDSLVLVTTFRTRTGTVELTDALALAEGLRAHDLGRGSPHALLRRARCVDGEAAVRVEFVPRFEYGLTTPIVRAVEGGVTARGGPT